MGKSPSSPNLPPGRWWKNISTQWVSVRFALFFSIRFGVFSESKSTQCRDWRGFPRGKVRSRRRRSIVVRFMCLLILSFASAKSHYNTHCGPLSNGRKEKLTFFCIFHRQLPCKPSPVQASYGFASKWDPNRKISYLFHSIDGLWRRSSGNETIEVTKKLRSGPESKEAFGKKDFTLRTDETRNFSVLARWTFFCIFPKQNLCALLDVMEN